MTGRPRLIDRYALRQSAGPLLALTLAGSVGLRPSYAAGAVLLALAAVGLVAAFRRETRTAAARALS